MFGVHDEYMQSFEEAPRRKLSEIIRAIAGEVENIYGKDGDETVAIRRGTLILWAEELESLVN
ncbi:MAG TPA: hypothetical protein ENI23_12305 [bacterium]|nr:hypothetical protein [bacterium]